jgi:2-C-methyl-D-erythritol 4-phosphate cytidylyltransferase
MTSSSDASLARLAQLVKERRLELGLGIQPAAAVAGMSKDTWKRVEAGQMVRGTTYSAIDRTLQWAPGSCVQILDGSGPVAVRPVGNGTVLAEDLASEVESSVKLAAIAVSDTLTAAEIRDLSQRVIEDLRRRGVI